MAERQRISLQGRLHLNGTQHKSVDDEHVQKVIGILDDNQKTEYAKMREEREKKRRQEQQAKK